MKEFAEDSFELEEGGNLNIDFKKYIDRLKDNKKIILIWTLVAIVLGVVIALTTPRKYSTMSKLAPELSNNAVNRLTSLSQLAGLNSTILGTTDAVYPMVYPDIISSTAFVVDLFETPVSFVRNKELKDTTLYGYMLNYQKKSLLGTVMSVPGSVIGWAKGLLKKSEEQEPCDTLDSFHLSKEQFRVAKKIRQSLEATIDKKTMVVTIVVSMQDPVVSATVSKAVNDNLRKYVTRYRTQKAKQDLAYYQRLFDDAKQDYFEAQNRYARYVDYNQGVIRQSVRVEMTRLQNEVNLKYSLYSNISQQLQNAQAKVQQETPVFVDVIPPTVPMKPSKPSRKMIVLVITFLGFIAACTYVIIKKK